MLSQLSGDLMIFVVASMCYWPKTEGQFWLLEFLGLFVCWQNFGYFEILLGW
jgi:hypothetical protein